VAALAEVGMGLDFLADHPRALAAASTADVTAAAHALLAPSALSTVLLGDAAAVAGEVAALGPVETG
jgi:predicted Zn-dependent peptidase